MQYTITQDKQTIEALMDAFETFSMGIGFKELCDIRLIEHDYDSTIIMKTKDPDKVLKLGEILTFGIMVGREYLSPASKPFIKKGKTTKKKRKIMLDIEFEQYPFSSVKNEPQFETEILSLLHNTLNEDRLIIKDINTSNVDEIKLDTIIIK